MKHQAPGQDFTVDVKDERFAAVLEGDTRFGIDRTDPSFKVKFSRRFGFLRCWEAFWEGETWAGNADAQNLFVYLIGGVDTIMSRKTIST